MFNKLAITTGILWLAASLFLAYGGDQYILWMALIPAAYIGVIQILRD